MRVFVTGASGWIGSATVTELLGNGHTVVGLARSDSSAAALEAQGAEVLRGDLDDLAGLRTGADDAEAVVHLANKHDFANPVVSNKAERDAVETIAEALVGSDRPLLIASGAASLASGRPATEDDASPAHGPDSMRGGSENLVLSYAERGVRAGSVRFAPTVHGAGDHGFISVLVEAAREQGVARYVDEGQKRWGAVHRSDAARLVRLGLEQAEPGAVLHAFGETGVPTRDIAEAIGRGLGVPVESVPAAEAADRLGWIAMFFGMDMAASSERTRQRLEWTPTGPTLLEDLAGPAYFQR